MYMHVILKLHIVQWTSQSVHFHIVHINALFLLNFFLFLKCLNYLFLKCILHGTQMIDLLYRYMISVR